MEAGRGRIAQVFIWKQGAAPDLSYARQVLSIANQDAYKAASTDSPPLQFFSVTDPWHQDFWPRALQDMRALPAPDGISWADTSRYRLEGWQGTDSRSGSKLFIVTVYFRQSAISPDAVQGAVTQPPVGMPPAYYPQYPPYQQYPPPYPTAPLGWPPQYPTAPLGWPPQGQQSGQLAPMYPYPPYPPGYGPMMTGPLPMMTGVLPPLQPEAPQVQPQSALGSRAALPDSYAPFYAGFGPRLAAVLIDFFFMSLLQAVPIAGTWWVSTTETSPNNFEGWLLLYGPFLCLSLLIFMLYHLIGWSVSGRTLGKKLVGIKIVRSDGSAPGFGRSLLRLLGYVFSTAIAGFGFLLIAFDPKRQGLHDKIAETYVVPDKPSMPAPAGLPGYRTAGRLPTVGAAAALPAMATAAPATGMAFIPGSQVYEVVEVPMPVPAPAKERVQNAPPEREQYAEAAPTEPAVKEDLAASSQVLEGRTSAESSAHQQARTPSAAQPTQAGQTTQAGHATEPYMIPSFPTGPLGPVTDALLAQTAHEEPGRASDVEKARALFRSGLAALEKGVRRGFGVIMEVEPGAAQLAAERFFNALQLVPNAIAYRYFYAVALRYSAGFETASREFSQVLELDPGHYEARRQVAFGPRWHDAFSYPAWSDPTPVKVGAPLPEAVRLLLPQSYRSGTRLVLLREWSSKMLVAVCRTRRDSWDRLPTPDMPARIELVLTRTPSGPVIAFYVVLRDDPDNPYKGETFLNPHDSGQPSDDACQLGQHMLAQLSRQDHTYLIFVDEKDQLLLSRKLVFDAPTQVNVARVLYDVQALPQQVMDPGRFQQAAQWHMDHFALDQIK